jgi:hypothetical protein
MIDHGHADVADAARSLLRDAMTTLDHRMLARIIGVPIDRLEAWRAGDATMAFADRIGSAMAIVTLAPVGSELFRRAARLRAELAASIGAGVNRDPAPRAASAPL